MKNRRSFLKGVVGIVGVSLGILKIPSGAKEPITEPQDGPRVVFVDNGTGGAKEFVWVDGRSNGNDLTEKALEQAIRDIKRLQDETGESVFLV